MNILYGISGISTFISLLYTSFSNPGIYKKLSPGVVSSKGKYSLINEISPIVMIGEKNFILKFCVTCQILRDVRVFHCKYCDHCIERHGILIIIKIIIALGYQIV